MAKGHKIALVLAQQQGLWATLESILARKERLPRRQFSRRETTIAAEREYAESLCAGTNAQADSGWKGFFDALEKTGSKKFDE